MVKQVGKRKLPKTENVDLETDELDLWSKKLSDAESEEAESSDSESEESVYSGLEEEDESSEDESEETGKEETASGDEDDEDKELEEIAFVNGTTESDDNENEHEEEEEGEEEEEEDKIEFGQPGEEESQKVSNLEISVKDAVEELNEKTRVVDEYDEDSSDEEDIRNTVGNIPMQWYNDYEHIGYDLDGCKIKKPQKGDELDNFLNKMDDPNYWRTVVNKLTGQKVILSDEDVDIIKRVQLGKHPDRNEDPYKPWIDFFSYETMIHPLSNRPPDKRSFIPSKWERLKVGQLVHSIKMGWLKPKKKKKKDPDDEEKNKTFFMLWKDNDMSEMDRRFRHHIPAPKLALPGHGESYNPPPEYLFTPEEEKKWEEKEPYERRIKLKPQKYSSLRAVPGYSNFTKERFERCLDLYLCPRKKIMKVKDLDPHDLLPQLPKPKDLQPFPTTQSIVYKGHKNMVRCISVHSKGQWLVSGSDDCTIKVWEISTGRCVKTISVDGVVKSVAWNPNPSLCLVAAVVDQNLLLINPGILDKLIVSNTDELLRSCEARDTNIDGNDDETAKKVPVTWETFQGKDYENGLRIKLAHPQELNSVSWHAKGDYFTSVMPKAFSIAVLIHQLTKRRSQNPFTKSKGIVQRVMFHPIKPLLFVATQRYVRIYNLLKQELVKKLMTNVKWVSSMAIHPGGDNVIVGSYDCRLSWFDLDLSTKPYKTLRHHKKAIRQVCYHRTYPLFASASDDCSLIVCHGMVYNDLLQNPLLVPVKILHGHDGFHNLGVLDCQFHPTQPWLFSSGADSTIRLFT